METYKGQLDRCSVEHTKIVSCCIDTTREQTLERCPNLALASAFFAPGTKGYQPGLKVPAQRSSAGQGSLVLAGITNRD